MENYIINADAKNKEEAIDLLVDIHYKAGTIDKKDELKRSVLKREAELSTFVGSGIAIPHARLNGVKAPSLAAITLEGEIEWGNNKVHTVFMLASPDDDEQHIKSLSALANILYDML